MTFHDFRDTLEMLVSCSNDMFEVHNRIEQNY